MTVLFLCVNVGFHVDVNMSQRDSHCLCKFPFILGSCFFGSSRMLNDIWILWRCSLAFLVILFVKQGYGMWWIRAGSVLV